MGMNSCYYPGMPTHVVRRGECVETIAYANGLAWQALWDHDQNSSLRELRSDPQELVAGDELFVPEREVESVDVATGQRHKVRLKGIPSKVKLRFLDEHGEPRTGPYELEVAGRVLEGELADGWIEHSVMPDIPFALVRVERPASDTAAVDEDADLDDTGAEADAPPATDDSEPGEPTEPDWEEHRIQLGHLDPIDTIEGIQGRLLNLGYYEGSLDGIEGPVLELAVVMFQADHDLTPSGIIDDQTRAELGELATPP